MRRLFLILVLISTATTTLLAQVGFEGGLNMANLAIQSGGSSVSTNFLAGAVGGIFILNLVLSIKTMEQQLKAVIIANT
jgi:hypothetical protein